VAGPTLSETLLMLNQDGMGHGPEDLRRKLVANYLNLLVDSGQSPGAVALYARGVLLATEDSPVREALVTLEQRGTHVILCKTCLDALGVADRVAVGIVGGMGDIIAAQAAAAKVITL
jgi:hypothetical protein